MIITSDDGETSKQRNPLLCSCKALINVWWQTLEFCGFFCGSPAASNQLHNLFKSTVSFLDTCSPGMAWFWRPTLIFWSQEVSASYHKILNSHILLPVEECHSVVAQSKWTSDSSLKTCCNVLQALPADISYSSTFFKSQIAEMWKLALACWKKLGDHHLIATNWL